MKYFIIAGEKSGDLHGSNLIKGLKQADPEAIIKCWGGDRMNEAGGELLNHYSSTAVMGYLNVLLNIRKILNNFSLCKRQIKEFRPDVVILIDYPGFNLRIAEFSGYAGFRVFYYIAPKVWAWKEYRVEKMKRSIERLFIIFPFEVEYFKRHNISAVYKGNPLVDEIDEFLSRHGDREELRLSLGLDNRPVIAMLAGSRNSEVSMILPEMLKTVKYFTDHQFVLAAVDNIPLDKYRRIIGDAPVKVITGKTYEILSVAEAALVKSGTSTLEAALLGVPQTVCYKGDRISVEIVKRLVKIRYISLVNLIMDREVVRELIQNLMTGSALAEELKAILPGGAKREKMLLDYRELREMLGPGGASFRIAAEMVRQLKNPGII